LHPERIIDFHKAIVEHIAGPDIFEIPAVRGIQRSNPGGLIVPEYHFIAVAALDSAAHQNPDKKYKC
jgi:hypothetical protein